MIERTHPSYSRQGREDVSFYISELVTNIFSIFKKKYCPRSNQRLASVALASSQGSNLCFTKIWRFILLVVLPFILLVLTERTEASWWFVSQTGRDTPLSRPRVLCNNIPGLVRRQRILCNRNTDLIHAVADGVVLGIQECQFQFRNTLWNCSIIPRDASVFGGQILRNTRESSFVHAVNSAAVVYAITRACNQGQLENCKCESSRKGEHKDKRGQFTWGGCSDNLRYSSAFTRRFIDAAEKRQRDVKSKVVLHNNRVGRKSIRKQTRLQCKCHGVSGSCSYKTCWLKMSHFRESSNWLKRRFDKAVEVIAKPDGTGLLPRTRRRLRKIDLVYHEKSPDYCQTNAKSDSESGNRQCNASSTGNDGCFALCCGRGFFSQMREVKSQCECKFEWCCKVTCKTCEVWKLHHFCNM